VNTDLWPLLVYSVIVIALIAGLLVASSFLGQKRKDHATHDVYESGVVPTGSANLKINVPFYRTAILFIIFDLEAAFLFAWAISIRESGWLGFVEVFIFIFILIAGLLYLWRSGALEWRTQRQVRDLAGLAGEGGVVNVDLQSGSKKVVAQQDAHGHGHDDHGHDAHGAGHTGAAH
jgi:NADH-quinone oxidoreductase subunit A